LAMSGLIPVMHSTSMQISVINISVYL
jgi:hypothetical protein